VTSNLMISAATNSTGRDLLVERALASLSLPGTRLGYRIITEGDQNALLPAELESLGNTVTKVRRASGAARIAARELMESFGRVDQPIPKSSSGAPIWPEGIVGSLAHDATIAVAALAASRDFMSVGIDLEPAEALEPDLLDLIAKPSERAATRPDPFGGRVLFVAKEAVYKAVYPLDRVFLDHHDVEVDFTSRTARVRSGRTVSFRFAVSNHIVALAFVPQ
jgi:4'-phosphopantetheinyl transferase EntD